MRKPQRFRTLIIPTIVLQGALAMASPVYSQIVPGCLYGLSTGIVGPDTYTPGEASTLRVSVSMSVSPNTPSTTECYPGVNPLPLKIYIQPGNILLGDIDIYVVERPSPVRYVSRGAATFPFPNLPVGSYRVVATGFDGGGVSNYSKRLDIEAIPLPEKKYPAKKAIPAVLPLLAE